MLSIFNSKHFQLRLIRLALMELPGANIFKLFCVLQIECIDSSSVARVWPFKINVRSISDLSILMPVALTLLT